MTKLDYATPMHRPKRDVLFYVGNIATMAPGVLMLLLLLGDPNGNAPEVVRFLSMYMIVVQLAVGALTFWRRRHLWGLAAASLGLHILNLLLSSTVARGIA